MDSHHANWTPGTVQLEDLQRNGSTIILQPTPTADPNDPLNWSKARKAVNFTLAIFYTLFTFVLLDIGPVIWGTLNEELGISFQNLNNSFAANTSGLAVGCIFLLPIAHKYGRRPLYLVSLAVQFACSIWFAKMNTNWENILINVIAGVGGSVSEAIVQMTVADIFFVHQRATMNAIYFFAVTAGAYLAPVAAGYSAASQGWRWIWWWSAIFLGVNLVAAVFLFEETKYTITLAAVPRSGSVTEKFHEKDPEKVDPETLQRTETSNSLTFPKRAYRDRLSLFTRTPTPIFRHMWQPFAILVQFPAVMYTSLMYGSQLAWFSVVSTTASTYLLEEPYSFGVAGIGLMNLAPFVGCVFASVIGGPLTDRYILWRAKRNKGIFEPEMRLHLSLCAIVLCPAGILLYGLSLAKGYPWMVLAVGYAMYGFGWTLVGDQSLTYLVDCYQDIIGDALVAVAFVRNGIATIIVFAVTPWIYGLGLYNFFISVGVIALVCLLTTIPMIWFGKHCRGWTRERYGRFAKVQTSTRTFLGQ
ncbi:major facilitator superfamily transporter [Corynespora cassiicola Philippines]|uniref:Major facilitator superfamily transporter n=1 Tax=Corynespora cassiicola Philippines TaxID=1448308 RepID=A0A2T2NWR7_CORCC|nr:major facilitator superfamily transporter [Corynespora cassiicola Philippines]